jgi:hypothetical protein
MLQLKHLHCLLHKKIITTLPTVQSTSEGSATAAAAVRLQHNVPARTDRCRELKHFDSGTDICQSHCGKAGEEKTEELENIERHKNGILTGQSNV